VSGIIDTIRKLLALADENNGGTDGERDAAASKAAKLMAEHRVTEAELAASGESGPIGVEERELTIIPHGSLNEWQDFLAAAIAATVDVHVVMETRSVGPSVNRLEKRVTIIGRPTSLDYVRLMYEWIKPQLVRAVMPAIDTEATKWKRHGLPASTKHLNIFRASYLRGLIETIWSRLETAQKDVVGTDIVLSDREAVKRFVRSAYGEDLKPVDYDDRLVDERAELLGQIDGHDIDIAPSNKVAAGATGQLEAAS
jgi:hypothetical protein